MTYTINEVKLFKRCSRAFVTRKKHNIKFRMNVTSILSSTAIIMMDLSIGKNLERLEPLILKR